MQIEEFFYDHKDMRDWCRDRGVDTVEDWWRLETRIEYRIYFASKHELISERNARLFACFCLGQISANLKEPSITYALTTAKAFASGNATHEEMTDAGSIAEKLYAGGDFVDSEVGDAAWLAWCVTEDDAYGAMACVSVCDFSESQEREQVRWLMENAPLG